MQALADELAGLSRALDSARRAARFLDEVSAPDVAIEIERPGRPAQVLIFDPKYRLDSEELGNEITDGRPMKVDIDKMHARPQTPRLTDGDRADRW
jgi:PD-(D/E)XK nuclease superfamily protein